jgi:hypothetical protein
LRAVAVEEVRASRWRERLEAGNKTAAGAASPHDSDVTLRGEGTAAPSGTRDPVPPGPLQWRPGAMKVLISDLLFPGDPSSLLVPLASGSGIGVVLAPALAEEAELPWRGNVDLVDCESNTMRRQRIDDALAERYRAAYARHFALWREAGRKRGVLFTRVSCENALSAVLGGEAFAAGAVEAVQ